MTTYWHGGALPQDHVLTPQPTRRDGTQGDGWVYITTNRDLAATYAATLPGYLMEVIPDGPVEADPGSMLSYSLRCRTARVVRVHLLTGRERRKRISAVQEAQRALLRSMP